MTSAVKMAENCTILEWSGEVNNAAAKMVSLITIGVFGEAVRSEGILINLERISGVFIPFHFDLNIVSECCTILLEINRRASPVFQLPRRFE